MLPLFVGAMVCLLWLFRLMQVERIVTCSLAKAGEIVAVEAGLEDSGNQIGSIEFATAELTFRRELDRNEYKELVEEYVRGGAFGISLLGSELDGEMVRLKASYYMRNPVGFFGKGQYIEQRFACRKWIGLDENEQNDSDWVYVTDYGSVYHQKRECSRLKVTIMQCMTKDIEKERNKNGARYHRCSFCMDEGDSPYVVYYTDQGDFYHGKIDCLSLKRNIQMIPISEVGDRRPCHFCGGE